MSLKTAAVNFVQGAQAVFQGPSRAENLFVLDGRVPFRKSFWFSLQHVFAMFGGNIAPLLIVFSVLGLTNSSLGTQAMMGAIFVAGLSTLIEVFLGSRLPMVMGASFTCIPIFITIGLTASSAEEAYGIIMASSLVGSAALIVFASFYPLWTKVIKPIVPAVVVLAVGLSLMSSGATDFFGGSDVLSAFANGTNGVPYYWYPIVGAVTLLSALLFSAFVKGVWKNLNIVFGMVVGYLMACCIPGMVDFSSLAVKEAVGPHGWIGSPLFVDFSLLRFQAIPCLVTSLCLIANCFGSVGNSETLSQAAEGKSASVREIRGALVGEGVGCALASLFGCLPVTSYAQNVGLVAQTKIVNRSTIAWSGIFLIAISFFPPIASFLYTIPACVIGGAMVILFGDIAVIGMKMIANLGFNPKNILIVAIASCLGFGTSIASDFLSAMSKKVSPYLSGALSNCVVNMFILSFILSWLLPGKMNEDSSLKSPTEPPSK